MSEKIIFLEGENIYLRSPELSDIPVMTRWINDCEVTRYLTARFPINTLNEEEYVRGQGKDRENMSLLIVLKEGDKPIGSLGLHQIHSINRNAELGILIGEKKCWGNGYGPEAINLVVEYAFDFLNLHKVSLHVYQSNERAQKAYEKCGFKKNAILPEEVFINGKYEDVYVMSILRKERK